MADVARLRVPLICASRIWSCHAPHTFIRSVPTFVRVATCYPRFLTNSYFGTESIVLCGFVGSDNGPRVLSEFPHKGAALPDVSAAVASVPPRACWLVLAAWRFVTGSASMIPVHVCFLCGANDAAAAVGLRNAFDASVPGVSIRICQRHAPVGFHGTSVIRTTRSLCTPEQTDADLALIAVLRENMRRRCWRNCRRRQSRVNHVNRSTHLWRPLNLVVSDRPL